MDNKTKVLVETHQILRGAGAPSTLLNQLAAAINDELLPHETILNNVEIYGWMQSSYAASKGSYLWEQVQKKGIDKGWMAKIEELVYQVMTKIVKRPKA
jgi:hypothetical protein